MVKAKGSRVTLDTPVQCDHFFPPRHPEVDVEVGMPAGKICMHSRTFFFFCELTDLSHCISLNATVGVSYETTLTSFECIFSVDPKNLSTHKCVATSSQGISFPLLSFGSGSKNVNKRQYLEICEFHIPLKAMNEDPALLNVGSRRRFNQPNLKSKRIISQKLLQG